MGNKVINKIKFEPNQYTAIVKDDLWQWDRGQTLRIEGLELKDKTTIHFGVDGLKMAIPMTGTLVNGAIEVDIPTEIFEYFSRVDYIAKAWIYKEDLTYDYVYKEELGSAETTHEIIMNIKARPMPEDYPNKDEGYVKPRHLIGRVGDTMPTEGIPNGSTYTAFGENRAYVYMFDEEFKKWHKWE